MTGKVGFGRAIVLGLAAFGALRLAMYGDWMTLVGVALAIAVWMVAQKSRQPRR